LTRPSGPVNANRTTNHAGAANNTANTNPAIGFAVMAMAVPLSAATSTARTPKPSPTINRGMGRTRVRYATAMDAPERDATTNRPLTAPALMARNEGFMPFMMPPYLMT